MRSARDGWWRTWRGGRTGGRATEQELAPLLKLAALPQKQGDSFEEGVRISLQAMLLSPNFLFRIERDPPGRTGAYRLNDYELASRLSYFLWSSMPDEELLRAADAAALRRAGRARSAGPADAEGSEVAARWSDNFGGTVAEPAADGSQEAGCGEVPDGGRRAAGCDAAGDAAVRRAP